MDETRETVQKSKSQKHRAAEGEIMLSYMRICQNPGCVVVFQDKGNVTTLDVAFGWVPCFYLSSDADLPHCLACCKCFESENQLICLGRAI